MESTEKCDVVIQNFNGKFLKTPPGMTGRCLSTTQPPHTGQPGAGLSSSGAGDAYMQWRCTVFSTKVAAFKRDCLNSISKQPFEDTSSPEMLLTGCINMAWYCLELV